MRKNRTEDSFICPECGCDEYEIEEEWCDNELIAQDKVCNNCGYREIIY